MSDLGTPLTRKVRREVRDDLFLSLPDGPPPAFEPLSIPDGPPSSFPRSIPVAQPDNPIDRAVAAKMGAEAFSKAIYARDQIGVLDADGDAKAALEQYGEALRQVSKELDPGLALPALQAGADVADFLSQLGTQIVQTAVVDPVMGVASLFTEPTEQSQDVGAHLEAVTRTLLYGDERPLDAIYDEVREHRAQRAEDRFLSGLGRVGGNVLGFVGGVQGRTLKAVGTAMDPKAAKIAQAITGGGRGTKLVKEVAKALPMAGTFGALSAVSDWYDPATGETRDGAERIGHGLWQTLYFPAYHALGIASSRMIGAAQDKGALTQAATVALGAMMENAGFTVIDAELRRPLIEALQSGDPERMQREAEKFVQGTLSFMALHAGSVANIPRMQRGSSRFGAGSQPGGGQRQPGGGGAGAGGAGAGGAGAAGGTARPGSGAAGAAQREFDFPDTPGHRRSGWNSQETAWAHDPRNRSYAQRTEPGVLMDLMDGRMRLQDVGVEVDKSGIRAHNGKLIVHVDGKLFATDLLEPGQWSEYHDTEVRLTPPAPPNQRRIAATVGQELAQLQLPDELRPLAAKTVELLATVNRQVDEPVEDALRVVEDGTLFEALRRNPAEALLGWARIAAGDTNYEAGRVALLGDPRDAEVQRQDVPDEAGREARPDAEEAPHPAAPEGELRPAGEGQRGVEGAPRVAAEAPREVAGEEPEGAFTVPWRDLYELIEGRSLGHLHKGLSALDDPRTAKSLALSVQHEFPDAKADLQTSSLSKALERASDAQIADLVTSLDAWAGEFGDPIGVLETRGKSPRERIEELIDFEGKRGPWDVTNEQAHAIAEIIQHTTGEPAADLWKSEVLGAMGIEHLGKDRAAPLDPSDVHPLVRRWIEAEAPRKPPPDQPLPASLRRVRVADTDPATMTGSQINRELDRLSKAAEQLTDAFIGAGRGSERPSDLRGRTDPLSVLDAAVRDRLFRLREEIRARTGDRTGRAPRGGARVKAPKAPPPEPAAEPRPGALRVADVEVDPAELPEVGRFGQGLVFISDVLEAARARGFSGTPEEFKADLLRRHRARELELVRANLVQAMPREKVEASLLEEQPGQYGTPSFHFVRLPAEAPVADAPPSPAKPKRAPRAAKPKPLNPAARDQAFTAWLAERNPDLRHATFGGFGPTGKVFVADAWKAVQAVHPEWFPGGLPEFKRELVRLARARRVELARADLVEAMDPSVVAESEIRDAHATFHFVRPLEAPRPRRAGESGRASPKALAGVAAVGALGVIDPTYIPIAVAGVIMAKPAKHVGGWLYERWAVSVLDRVARQGADVGTELRERAIAAVDHTKRLIGEWEAQTTEALTHMSRAPLGVGRRHATAVRTLSEVVPFSLAAPMAEAAGLLGGGSSTPVAPSEARAYFTRFHLAAEGILDRAALTPEEQRIVDLYQGLRNRIVESAAAMGVEMRLRDGTWAPVQPDPARQRMLRRWTPEGIDVLRNAFDAHGNPTPDGQALALAIAEANGWVQTKALAELRAYSDRADMVRNSVEQARSIPLMPDHVRLDNGVILRVLESTPFEATSSMAYGAAHRLGVIAAFGQSKDSLIETEWVERYAKARGNPAVVTDLFRALHGINVDPPRLAPSHPLYPLYRWVRAGINIRNSGLLTRAFIPNMPEFLGNTGGLMGMDRAFRAWGAIFSHREPLAGAAAAAAGGLAAGPAGAVVGMALGPVLARSFRTHRPQLLEELARRGAITVDIPNFRLSDRQRRPETVARVSRWVAALQTAANELNDAHAGVTAMVWAGDLAAGKATEADAAALRVFRFTPEEIEEMVRGNGGGSGAVSARQAELYERLIRTAASVTQGSGLKAEQSRAMNSRLFRLLMPFQTYATTKAARTVEVVGQWFESIQGVLAAPRDSAAQRTFLAHTRLATRFLGGSVLAGSLSRALALGFRYGAGLGLAMWIRDWLSDPEEAVKEAAFYSLAGGALSTAIETVTESAEAGKVSLDTLVRAVAPLAAINEITQFVSQTGRYRDRPAVLDRAQQFLAANLAISRDVAMWAATLGLSENDVELDAALSRYYEWRRNNAPLTRLERSGATTEEKAEARVHMRTVRDLLQDGVAPTDDRVIEAIRSAIQAREGNRRAIASSLYARRIMSGAAWSDLSAEQRQELREHLGEKLWAKIAAYDAVLTELGRAVGRSR